MDTDDDDDDDEGEVLWMEKKKLKFLDYPTYLQKKRDRQVVAKKDTQPHMPRPEATVGLKETTSSFRPRIRMHVLRVHPPTLLPLHPTTIRRTPFKTRLATEDIE